MANLDGRSPQAKSTAAREAKKLRTELLAFAFLAAGIAGYFITDSWWWGIMLVPFAVVFNRAQRID